MLFTVGLSRVIAISAARVQLRLCSKYPRLASTHARSLVKVICFSQGTVASYILQVKCLGACDVGL